MPNEVENESTEDYGLSNTISKPLEQHRLWPSFNALRSYTVATCAAGFRKDDYAALSQNVPSAPRLLIFMLARLRDTCPQFVIQHLKEHWHQLLDEELFARYAVSRSNQSESEAAQNDYVVSRLEVMMTETCSQFESLSQVSPHFEELRDQATRAILLSCLDQHIPPQQLEHNRAFDRHSTTLFLCSCDPDRNW